MDHSHSITLTRPIPASYRHRFLYAAEDETGISHLTASITATPPQAILMESNEQLPYNFGCDTIHTINNNFEEWTALAVSTIRAHELPT